MNIKNIAFYAFYKPSYELISTRDLLRQRMRDLGVRGSILLAEEGINCSLSGKTEDVDSFLDFIFATINIERPEIKVSFSDSIAFKRSLVKVKPFIVHPPGDTAIDLQKDSAPYISPEEFHQWVSDNKEMVILDTRNDYEFDVGRFKNAVHLGTKHFADFEEDLKKAPDSWRNTSIVTFCTGGIRCEKAAPLMLKKGFNKVYQLEGGILNYFKKMGLGHYEGECFVFDHRDALNERLECKTKI